MKYLVVTATSVAAFMMFVACGNNNNSTNNGTNNGSNNGTTGSNNGTTNPNNGSTGSNNGTTGSNNGTTGSNNGTIAAGTWVKGNGPCPGSKTNALWFDDRQNGFAGCGENAAGEGLYTTTDGGATWSTLTDWDPIRVNDIHRTNGTIFVAGAQNNGGDTSVWSLNEANGEREPLGYIQSGTISQVQQGQNVFVSSGGAMMIDSLTGTQIAVKSAVGMWEEVGSIHEDAIAAPDSPGFQVSRLLPYDDRPMAVGSLINDPARIYLPSKDPAATYHVAQVDLQAPNEDGESYDAVVLGLESIVVAGWDRTDTRRPPMVFVAAGDPYDAANWTTVDTSGLGYNGGVWSLSNDGNTVIAFGEKAPSSQGGFVLRSDDAGVTWTDITPTERVLPLSEGWLFGNGDIIASGGNGELWTYTAE